MDEQAAGSLEGFSRIIARAPSVAELLTEPAIELGSLTRLFSKTRGVVVGILDVWSPFCGVAALGGEWR